MKRETLYIYGKHALMEALREKPQAIRKVFLSAEATRDRELVGLLGKLNVPVALMKKRREASRLVGDEAVHQGVIASASSETFLVDFREFLRTVDPSARTMVVLLDGLTDPQNVGAIIRSAAAFGAGAVLLPSRNQAPLTGAVVKSSAGMAFRVPLVSIGNVNYAIDALQKKGFKAYALDMHGKTSITKEAFDDPAVFVVGNEGKGIGQKTLERCDVTLRIPMDPRCESLNASVSAAVVLYEWSRRAGAAKG